MGQFFSFSETSRGVVLLIVRFYLFLFQNAELKKIYDTIREDPSTTGEIFEKSILSL